MNEVFYNEGQEAYWDGYDHGQCPYPYDSPAGARWQDGFEDAWQCDELDDDELLED